MLWEKYVHEKNNFDFLLTSKNNLNKCSLFFPSKRKTGPVRITDTCNRIIFLRYWFFFPDIAFFFSPPPLSFHSIKEIQNYYPGVRGISLIENRKYSLSLCQLFFPKYYSPWKKIGTLLAYFKCFGEWDLRIAYHFAGAVFFIWEQ